MQGVVLKSVRGPSTESQIQIAALLSLIQLSLAYIEEPPPHESDKHIFPQAYGAIASANWYFILPSGEQFCLYQHLEANVEFRVSVYVTNKDDSYVRFKLTSPSGVMLKEEETSDVEHREEATTEAGVFKICMETPYYQSDAQVHFTLDARDENAIEEHYSKLLGGVLKNLQKPFQKVRRNLNQVEYDLEDIRDGEAYDSFLLETTYNYVNRRSMLICAIVVICSLVQMSNVDMAGMVVSANMRFHLDAAEHFCLYQHLEPKNHASFSLQVMTPDGSQVGFEVKSPTGVMLNNSYGTEGGYVDETYESGDYSLCLQNGNSLSSVEVQVSIYSFDETRFQSYFENLTKSDAAIADLGEQFSKVYMNILTMKTTFTHLKEHESYDDNLVEMNYHYVNTWSLVQSIATLGCGVIQSMFIKRFFSRPYNIR